MLGSGVLYHAIENESSRKNFVLPHMTKILSASFLHPRIETNGVYTRRVAVLIDPEKVTFLGYGPCDLHSGDWVMQALPDGLTRNPDDLEYMKWRLKTMENEEYTDECPMTTSPFSIMEMQRLETIKKKSEGRDLYGQYNECVVELNDESAILAIVAGEGVESVRLPGFPIVTMSYNEETKTNSFTRHALDSKQAPSPSRTVTYTALQAEFQYLMECTTPDILITYLKETHPNDIPPHTNVSALQVTLSYISGSVEKGSVKEFVNYHSGSVTLWDILKSITFSGNV
jgi:hypothetical protein